MTNLGWVIEKALAATDAEIEASIVDCGTCPVNIACLVGEGGNGWKHDCCSSTAISTTTAEGEPLALVVDCQRNRFEKRSESLVFQTCSLCSSGVVEAELRGWSAQVRWLPTVHAAVPWRIRLATWRAAMPNLRARVEADRAIKERGHAKQEK